MLNNTCVKCSPNCISCNSQNGMCTICAKDFYMHPTTHQCLRLTIDNCSVQKDENTCEACKPNSYFDKQSKKCILC